SMCAGIERSARMPPWMAGCSVFTRPSIISGKPVTRSTGVTGTPCWASSAAVPPVERISTSCRTSPRANSTTPLLSETLIKARRTLVISTLPIQHLSQPLQLGRQLPGTLLGSRALGCLAVSPLFLAVSPLPLALGPERFLFRPLLGGGSECDLLLAGG